MDIEAYLERIDYTGARTPSIETLNALHRAHLLAIPYENLDIHLGRLLTLDPLAIFEKIVVQRRGGWCYEMNGLFACALRALGFSVSLLASAVNRAANGNNAERNHLVLQVHLDRSYLADVGFGNGFIRPLPLREGHYQQSFLDYRLAYDGERWHFANHRYSAVGYDFTEHPYQLSDFAERCDHLQTSPESGFVRVVVCHRFTPNGILSLRGAVLRTITAAGEQETTLDSETSYRHVLVERFDVHLPDSDFSHLWGVVWEKHQAFAVQ